MSNPPSPGDTYRALLEHSTQAARALSARFDRMANLRLAAAILAVACLLAGGRQANGPLTALLLLIGALASLAAFIVLMLKHARISTEKDRYLGLVQVNKQALARLDRNWALLPVPPVPAAARESSLASDLDLFGHGTLVHLVGTAGTPQGRHTLASWLLEPSAHVATTIPARQAAVAEMAQAVELRQDLEYFAADLHATVPTGDDPFLSWTASEPWLRARPALIYVARALTLLLPLSLLLLLAGQIDATATVLLLLVRWGVTKRYAAEIPRRLEQVCQRQRTIQSYSGLFSRLAHWSPAAPLLAEKHRLLEGADTALSQLQTLVSLTGMRTTVVNPLMQWVFLWDFHTLWFMEAWQERHGAQVRGWFEALGEVEAIAALSVLAFEEPSWPFPHFTDEPKIVARGLGHPLLPACSRVTNDVTLGPPGSFLLVTGSNMSGKSTLLRTLGINVVLAQAGAPVCATELRLPPALILATSLRVQDSLQEGVSFFMAELRRLASVVELVDRVDAVPNGPVVLYLLDEILRGTNTHERQIIVAKVITHLLQRRALGAVTTHDLSLAGAEGVAGKFQAVHFTEEFEDGPNGTSMRFDYQMRPGMATTTNALKLLKLIGLKL